MRAAIVTIGDELVIGQSLDTNTQAIADALTQSGCDILVHMTVPDDSEAIAKTLTDLARRCDLIITTGGLGPTADDLTRNALAKALGEQLITDDEALEQIRSWFSHRSMPETNAVQALRPRSATMLANEHGTAPGLTAQLGAATVFCLPGPPREMKPMFEREVLTLVRRQNPQPITTRTLYAAGLGESDIAVRLGELMDRDRPVTVGTNASLGIVALRLRADGPPSRVSAMVDQVADEIRRRLDPAVFSDRLDLPAWLCERLREKGQTLGTCESCTGGMIGQAITQIPGSSDVFAGGLITYTNRLKQSLAGVDAEILREHGAVSGQCARAMADGARQTLGTDHCVAITGIAGPGGGTADKPVGTVWIALASRDHATSVRPFLFKGARQAVRRWSASTALTMLRLRLDGVTMRLLGEQPS